MQVDEDILAAVPFGIHRGSVLEESVDCYLRKVDAATAFSVFGSLIFSRPSTSLST